MPPGTVLVVDDDAIECKSLSEFLRLEGYRVNSAESGALAMQRLDQAPYDVLLTDVNMPEVTGFDLLRHCLTDHTDTAVVLITGYGQIEGAVEAIKLGAYDYITKPLVDDGVKLTIDRALEQQRLKRENEELRKQLGLRGGFLQLLGRDHKMQRIYDLIDIVSDTKATVLITGESGTGKTLIARTIHARSSRHDKPFVEVSCGALPETLLESELFGHVRGAFTNAYSDRPGKFEQANGGTVFLDEISVASPALQVKLLRVLQDRVFERVGGTETVSADVRVIIATNRDLADEVEMGNFRQDLYYRINVVPIPVPPLRERICDVLPLADHFIRICSLQNNKTGLSVSEEAIRLMQQYPWPGNVRELENVIERAVILTRDAVIDADDLPQRMLSNDPEVATAPSAVLPLKRALEDPEREIIERALRFCDWNRQKAASLLQINRSTLFKKMRKYGLEAPDTHAGGQP
jgi:DNA-binding NtrC family response regulator